MPRLAAAFTAAITTRDRARLSALFADDIDFRGLTPHRFWEAHTPDEVASVILDHWFEEHDRIVNAHLMDVVTVADTQRMGYLFELETPDGAHVVEQQAYYRTDGERISYLRVLCSGFRPVVPG
ncbi:hypothetical protein [Nocardioides sp. Root140]|uniref:hypothetical protein n=1 Tax=Nocardioides sp. Root140 TaxID=1736460 RepID=UPI0006F74BBF|nr:hypothetical protein [Nocardioides sp. Root140]KQY56314.1 hypothetical protein ASD30_08145 [Nocardioides sp. Root140]